MVIRGRVDQSQTASSGSTPDLAVAPYLNQSDTGTVHSLPLWVGRTTLKRLASILSSTEEQRNRRTFMTRTKLQRSVETLSKRRAKKYHNKTTAVGDAFSPKRRTRREQGSIGFQPVFGRSGPHAGSLGKQF
jgi:hypothetical protein